MYCHNVLAILLLEILAIVCANYKNLLLIFCVVFFAFFFSVLFRFLWIQLLHKIQRDSVLIAILKQTKDKGGSSTKYTKRFCFYLKFE